MRAEAAALAAAGVGELVLVAQDLTGYGQDLGTPGGLADLLRLLSETSRACAACACSTCTPGR